MQIGALRGLGTARIDHDHPAVRILADVVEMIARIGKAVGDPRIGADHEQQVAVMDVLGGMAGLAAEDARPFTEKSPVFSCDSALKTWREPSARVSAVA